MGLSDLERLSREELMELVLRMNRPTKTSRTSFKALATDRKKRLEQSKPDHEGRSSVTSDEPGAVVDHRPHC